MIRLTSLFLLISAFVGAQVPAGALNEPGRKYFPNGIVLPRMTTVEMNAIVAPVVSRLS